MKLPGWTPRVFRGFLLCILTIGLLSPGIYQPYIGALAQAPEHHIFLPSISRVIPPNPNVPLPSPSYYFYMNNYTQAKARALGCELGTRDRNLPGKQDSIVILAFGIPKLVNGQYGASGMVRNGFVTMNQIADAVQQFGLGYWTCTGTDYDSHITLGIGTNNYNNHNVYDDLSVTYEHGRRWAQMVNQVAGWFKNSCTNGCNGQVTIVGANDIELAWSSPTVAIDWLNGYDSANLYPLYNFGAAEGCPGGCGGGGYSWTLSQVLRVHSTAPVYPMPEIYLNNGRNAQQWFQLSQYSVRTRGYPYDFVGVLTTYAACQQYPSGCEQIDNTPEEGWTQLNNLVNGSDLTTYDSFPFVSDIEWWQ